MNETLWEFPVPPTGLVRGPVFKALPKRQCEVSFSIEGEDGAEKWLTLVFGNVEVYRCTFLSSLTVDMIESSYGKLISIKNSTLLAEVNNRCKDYMNKTRTAAKNLKHFMICFDDGPCYEFICESYTVA